MAVINTVKRTRQMIKAIETQYDRVIHTGVFFVLWVSGVSQLNTVLAGYGQANQRRRRRGPTLSPQKGISAGPVFDSSSLRVLLRERRIAPRRKINRPSSSDCVARARTNLNYADDPAAQLCMYGFTNHDHARRDRNQGRLEAGYTGRGEVKQEPVGGSGSWK
ncbi:hypothetical protein C8R44DRAFT_726257 [Mycena epipterygia]|nr:hypothetical protein C8R44DRAFT_726257 [Mycena epipterygia]